MLANHEHGTYSLAKGHWPTPSVHDGFLPYAPHELRYIEADSNYTTVYVRNQKRLVICKCLKHVYDQLNGELWIRCHAKYAVNFMYVSRLSKARNWYLTLDDGTELPISRRKKKEVLNLVENINYYTSIQKNKTL